MSSQKNAFERYISHPIVTFVLTVTAIVLSIMAIVRVSQSQEKHSQMQSRLEDMDTQLSRATSTTAGHNGKDGRDGKDGMHFGTKSMISGLHAVLTTLHDYTTPEALRSWLPSCTHVWKSKALFDPHTGDRLVMPNDDLKIRMVHEMEELDKKKHFALKVQSTNAKYLRDEEGYVPVLETLQKDTHLNNSSTSVRFTRSHQSHKPTIECAFQHPVRLKRMYLTGDNLGDCTVRARKANMGNIVTQDMDDNWNTLSHAHDNNDTTVRDKLKEVQDILTYTDKSSKDERLVSSNTYGVVKYHCSFAQKVENAFDFTNDDKWHGSSGSASADSGLSSEITDTDWDTKVDWDEKVDNMEAFIQHLALPREINSRLDDQTYLYNEWFDSDTGVKDLIQTWSAERLADETGPWKSSDAKKALEAFSDAVESRMQALRHASSLTFQTYDVSTAIASGQEWSDQAEFVPPVVNNIFKIKKAPTDHMWTVGALLDEEKPLRIENKNATTITMYDRAGKRAVDMVKNSGNDNITFTRYFSAEYDEGTLKYKDSNLQAIAEAVRPVSDIESNPGQPPVDESTIHDWVENNTYSTLSPDKTVITVTEFTASYDPDCPKNHILRLDHVNLGGRYECVEIGEYSVPDSTPYIWTDKIRLTMKTAGGVYNPSQSLFENAQITVEHVAFELDGGMFVRHTEFPVDADRPQLVAQPYGYGVANRTIFNKQYGDSWGDMTDTGIPFYYDSVACQHQLPTHVDKQDEEVNPDKHPMLSVTAAAADDFHQVEVVLVADSEQNLPGTLKLYVAESKDHLHSFTLDQSIDLQALDVTQVDSHGRVSVSTKRITFKTDLEDTEPEIRFVFVPRASESNLVGFGVQEVNFFRSE